MIDKILSLKIRTLILISLVFLLTMAILQFYIDAMDIEKTSKLFLSILISVLAAFLVGTIIQFISDKHLKDDELTRMEGIVKNQLSYYIPGIHQDQNRYLGVKLAEGLAAIEMPSTIDIKKSHEISLLFVGFDITYFHPNFIAALNSIVSKKDSRINLLLLDPDTAAFRSRCYDRKYQSYWAKTYDAYKEFAEKIKLHLPDLDTGTQLNIKIYSDYPAFTMIKIDNHIWFTPMWNKISVKNQTYFTLNTNRQKVFDSFKDNFERLWQDPKSKLITASELERFIDRKLNDIKKFDDLEKISLTPDAGT